MSNEQLTFTCVISGNTLVWQSSLDATRYIGFIRSVDAEGAVGSLPSLGFGAVLTSKADSAMNSTLQFAMKLTLNGTAVLCTNGAFTPVVNKTLLVATIPEAPLNVSVANYTLNSVTLVWTPPKSDGLDDIFVYAVRVSGMGGSFVANLSAPLTSVVIPSLQYNTPYIYEVKAVNRVGTSPGTTTSFAISPEEPANPTNLTARELCGNSDAFVVLTWQLPSLSNLVPRPVSVVVNITQNGRITTAELQYNVSSYYVNNNLISSPLEINVYVKSPASSSKGTYIATRIDDYIISIEVTTGDTYASVKFQSCHTSSSAVLLSYYICNKANDTDALKAAIGRREGAIYRLDLSYLLPNTSYCFSAVMYDPASSQLIGLPLMGRFVTNTSLSITRVRATPSDTPSSSSPIVAEGARVDVTSVAMAIAITSSGAIILPVILLVFIFCLKLRRAKLSIQKSDPHLYLDTFKTADGVATVENVAYCTVAMAQALKLGEVQRSDGLCDSRS